ncbi:DUF2125 domain-containing protein [Pelagibius sp. CAU 1746]|uniref:DUF2125 domain-containing protein n=1 Tax=Pelagibius sp. CAU 1746 TaxID=3140370 RepID=UPI00325A9CFF
MPPMNRYRLAVFTTFALLLLAGALSGYWLWARQALDGGIAKWRAEQAARGYDIAYQGPEFAGFPFALSVTFREPRVVTPQGLTWQGPPVSGEAKLWAPFTIDLRYPGLHRLSLPAELARELTGEPDGTPEPKQVDVAAEEASGRVVLRRDGKVESAAVDLGVLQVSGAAIETITLQRLSARLGPLREGARQAGGEALDEVDLVGEALFVELPPGRGGLLGDAVARLSFDSTLIGGIPPGKPEEALPAWRDGGGRWRFHHLVALWGPLDLRAEGRLGLDEALRPAGLFEAELKGANKIIRRLIDSGKIKPEAALAAQIAVAAMGQTDGETGETVLAAPISLRQGLLYLGPIPLFPVAPVL